MLKHVNRILSKDKRLVCTDPEAIISPEQNREMNIKRKKKRKKHVPKICRNKQKLLVEDSYRIRASSKACLKGAYVEREKILQKNDSSSII